jgi:signal transduction histidine kinase
LQANSPNVTVERILALPRPAQQHTRALAPLRVLAAVLVGGALVVVAAAFFGRPSEPIALVLLALALAIAAVTTWRLTHTLDAILAESRTWAELTRLQASLAKQKAMMEALPAPFSVWDRQGKLLLASAAWRALGLPAETALTQSEVEVGDPPRTFVSETGSLADGSRLILLREVSREREALRAKDELLSIVGHELRTPLTTIKGYGQLMASQLQNVQEQVQRLDQLIGDVLDTSRAEGGQLTLQREPLSVETLLRSTAEQFRVSHQSRTLELDLRTSSFIVGDASRLSQVLDNLLSNAAKYSPVESSIVLRASDERGGDWVRIAVVDHGVGIAKEHVPRLFERFYRVPGQGAAAPPGFGLGLSIVRDLVEAHGGRVEVASDGLGAGCTFSILLPPALAIAPVADKPSSAVQAQQTVQQRV